MNNFIAITRNAFVASMLLLAACGGGGGGGSASPPPPTVPPSSTVLEIVQRDVSGALTGVAGIEVLRNDATTGAYIDSKVTDTAGHADFGVLPGPVTLSIVRTPPASGGAIRAYTLLGLPDGTTRVRLDRLPFEPATVRATVNVALSPSLSSTERAHVCLPGNCVGDASMASPGAAAFSNVPITDHDIQDDGLVTLMAEVQDDEMATPVGCRPYADLTVPASGATVPAPASPSVTPGTIATSGDLELSRVLAVRKGVAFSFRSRSGGINCAFAFSSGVIGGSPGAVTGTTGFSLQGTAYVGGADQPAPNFFNERWRSEKHGALWVNSPTLPVVPQTIPTADATIEALSYDTGMLHFTLKGTAVQSLVAARASLIWSPTGALQQGPLQQQINGPTDIRVWYLYSGLAVTPSSCDGTSANPDCSFAVKLPDLSAVGIPPDQSNGTQISLEAAAPTGAPRADDFWRMLAADGDVEAVLARGYTGAYRDSALWKVNFDLSVGDYITNSPNYNLGNVTGPGGIDCGGPQHPYPTLSCDATLPGGSGVTLTAHPNSGVEFVEWVGLCASSGAANPSITFVLNSSQSCTPRFRSLPLSKLLNVTSPQGANGLITSADGWIRCGLEINGLPPFPETCSFNYPSGTAVALTVFRTSNTGTGYNTNWTGDCAGATGNSTTVVMSDNRTCGVTYTPVP